MRQPAALRVAPRQLSSPLALVIALIAALAVSLVPGSSARAAASVPTASARAPQSSASVPKAVIIVGPVEGLTSTYLTYGEQWAKRAEAQGMDVRRLFSPYATWQAVLDNIQGAKLVVYLGHGNGWPSPYSPFQENTKDGFGLNGSAGAGNSNVKYYGANMVRASVHLASDSIVVLGHACYSPGTGETWQTPPTETVARQRVDNFAAGFLAAGARTYFAYYYEQTRDMVKDLFTTHQTMDELFMMKGAHDYDGFDGTYDPYSDSGRTPGARLHMDKSSSKGWLRAVAGDLAMTTDEWVGAPADPDATAPELSAFRPVKSTWTYAIPAPAGEEEAPVVFTPNGDGIADTVSVTMTVSEGSYVDLEVKDTTDDRTVRKLTQWVSSGTGTIVWDGKSSTGGSLPDGVYRLIATPRDRAGNVGASASADVTILTTMRSVVATPVLFYAADADELAATAPLSMTLTKPALVSWDIVATTGQVVATRLVRVASQPGVLSWTWDGRGLDGSFVKDALYYSVVTAATAEGIYSHRVGVTQSAFRLWSAMRSATGGVKVQYTITSAEPLSENPTVTVNQPGVTPWSVSSARIDATRYTVSITFKTGHPGRALLRVYGFDTNDAGQGAQFGFAVE